MISEMSSIDLWAGSLRIWERRYRLIPSVPVIIMAPKNKSHQALTVLPKKTLTSKLGMAKSASLARTAPPLSKKMTRHQMMGFKPSADHERRPDDRVR